MTHATSGRNRREGKMVHYRLRFCTMSMGRLTAQGDPQIFPFRTLNDRSEEGARSTQFVGKLIFLFFSALSTSAFLCFLPLLTAVVLLPLSFLATLLLSSRRTWLPLPLKLMICQTERTEDAATRKAKTARESVRKALRKILLGISRQHSSCQKH